MNYQPLIHEGTSIDKVLVHANFQKNRKKKKKGRILLTSDIEYIMQIIHLVFERNKG